MQPDWHLENYGLWTTARNYLPGRLYQSSFRDSIFNNNKKHRCPAVLTKDGLLGYIVGEAKNAWIVGH